ncbi:hypothetical protein [Sphingosinicella sp.]|uniref:hypothetical protein n=1 Tax=Sphingosinicella sp. TaxID=1917971 RepID=UPI0017F537BA|nr:hypothetical protein [Sphingosinicella sp.]MBA4760123.1 hypothetical protein [Sphingosinicella sp.]
MSHLRSFLMLGSALALVACGADDVASPGEGVIVTPTPTADCPTGTAEVSSVAGLRTCQVSGTITGSLVLRKLDGIVYSLSGVVQVGVDVGSDGTAPGGTAGILTIEPGVTVFGSSGADALVVNRGSQIYAEGTAAEPIVFTSRANIEGTSTAESIGQWGGLVILGRAPIGTCSAGGTTPGTAGCQAAVEGVTNAYYGGGLANDNSGRLKYFQIRYSGFALSAGNELNGITLAGVGRGTTFEYVQVHNSSDDGIEWFGGTVNGKHIVLTGNDDDSIDTDNGYTGVNQFVIVTHRATAGSAGGDYVWEAGSGDGSVNETVRQDTHFANVTAVANGGAAILLRGGGDYQLTNWVLAGAASSACLDIDGAATIQAAGAGTDENGPPVFKSVFFACAAPYIDDANVTGAQIQALFEVAGNNNTAAGTSTLTSVFVNGANESGVTAVNNLATVNSFFQNVDYIGAVRNAADTWWQGWTCGLGTGTACTVNPAN